MPHAATPWQPEPVDLAAQREAGRAFIARMLDGHDFTLAEGQLLLELGHVVSALASVRSQPRTGKTLKELAMLERLELGWSRQFASLMAHLKVSE